MSCTEKVSKNPKNLTFVIYFDDALFTQFQNFLSQFSNTKLIVKSFEFMVNIFRFRRHDAYNNSISLNTLFICLKPKSYLKIRHIHKSENVLVVLS